MVYIPESDSSDGIAKVVYESKDGKTSKTFDALDWLSHRRDLLPIYPTRANPAWGGSSRVIWDKKIFFLCHCARRNLLVFYYITFVQSVYY